MKVVHYLPEVKLAAGGVVRAVIDLCGVLAQEGAEVVLASTDAEDAPEAWRQTGGSTPRAVILAGGVAAGGRLGRAGVVDLERRLRGADALHVHTPWAPSNRQAASAAARLAVPVVFSPHGMFDRWSMAQKGAKKKAFWWAYARGWLKRTAAAHLTARGEAEQSRPWLCGRPERVIPLIVDLGPYREPPSPELARSRFLGADEARPVVLFLSRVHPKKGVHHLIDAVGRLRDRGGSVLLIVAGPGEPRYLDRLTRRTDELDLSASVRFVGMVSGELKLSLYAAADVMVLPTHQENFGLVIPEAMACETAVVTTREVDAWREFEEAGALLCEPDGGSVSDVLAAHLDDRDALRERGRRGRAWVMERLDPRRLAAQYLDLYGSVASARRGSMN